MPSLITGTRPRNHASIRECFSSVSDGCPSSRSKAAFRSPHLSPHWEKRISGFSWVPGSGLADAQARPAGRLLSHRTDHGPQATNDMPAGGPRSPEFAPLHETQAHRRCRSVEATATAPFCLGHSQAPIGGEGLVPTGNPFLCPLQSRGIDLNARCWRKRKPRLLAVYLPRQEKEHQRSS